LRLESAPAVRRPSVVMAAPPAAIHVAAGAGGE
jgi:hypothetical protein